MDIRLARIDDRLIHGQVATVWTKETKAERIIVVSDAVAKDDLRKTLLIQAAPPGVRVNVVDVAKAIRVYQNPLYMTTRVMLLFTNPMDVLTLVEAGVAIRTVNIGGMAFRVGKRQITNAVSVDEQDEAAFFELDKRGIELEIRKVASDSKVKLMPLLQTK
ncbi:PTS system mannose/fructose/sorbose family IIB component [Listeria floridensis FSL S10-1187]|uniref:PTS system mannose/fructose/sorbose family IIB component n=1 Tax=Listeria floridensis FSL S10-1187 TaxID=1265817 RepID=A0ABP3AYL9_9LIST|nr:mannose/fructose/sorbose PTS transporter subunit IIB [Listeria floridensis]EUJ30328.1 PTS system mannose/fructose/sorbose family IIB component [Listeria floridensis FSL S10-1187]